MNRFSFFFIFLCVLTCAVGCHGEVRRGLPSNADKETRALASQCDKGDLYSCHNVAVSIYLNKEATQDQQRMAHQLLEHACRTEVDLSCRMLSNLAQKEHHDPLAGVSYLDIACNRGDTDACIERAIRDIQAGELQMGIGRLEGLCEDRKSPHACMELGRRYAEADGVPLDLAKAKHLVHAPCALGSPVACRMRAEIQLKMIDSANDITRDITYQLGEACLADDEPACRRLAGLYHDGVGVEKDPEYAQSLLRRACQVQGPSPQCHEMLPAPTFK